MVNGNESIPDRAFTHCGVFHADDVFSAALLRILNPGIEFVRVAQLPDDFDGFAFDIGGGLFDHHFQGARVRDNGVPFASFGLLWEAFGERLLPYLADWRLFDERFVQPIDLADNTGAPCDMARAVACFNPAWDSHETHDSRFEAAVMWAQQALRCWIDAIAARRRAFDAMEQHLEGREGAILVLDRYLPCLQASAGDGCAFVVFPSLRGGFVARAVDTNTNGNGFSVAFPETWRGKSGDDLRRASGVTDIVFCHPSGFLCAAESQEGAIKAARKALATWKAHASFENANEKNNEKPPEKNLKE